VRDIVSMNRWWQENVNDVDQSFNVDVVAVKN
jgi:hypothetical protein